MREKLDFSKIVKPAAALFLICLVTTCLLALTNSVTAQRIEDMQLKSELESRTLVLPEAVSFESAQTAENGAVYCLGTDESGKTAGYVFTTSAKGYGGDVSVMTGVSPDGVITGITILSHEETPGLGANCDRQEFKDRFLQKSGVLTVDKNSNEGQSVQAITAATITSTAVVSAVNLALAAFDSIQGGAANG